MRETIIELFMCNGQKEREKKDKKKEIKGIKNLHNSPNFISRLRKRNLQYFG